MRRYLNFLEVDLNDSWLLEYCFLIQVLESAVKLCVGSTQMCNLMLSARPLSI